MQKTVENMLISFQMRKRIKEGIKQTMQIRSYVERKGNTELHCSKSGVLEKNEN